MISVNSIVKWVSLVTILGMLGYSIKWVYDYHIEQIEAAVFQAETNFALKAAQELKVREKELRDKSAADKAQIKKELIIEKQRIKELEKLLLIDHDLDRLLQEKPGLIIPRINTATAAYYEELERVTQ